MRRISIMKKTLLPIMIAGLALTGCRPAQQLVFCTTGLEVVTPTGAPALAFYNYAGLNNFETNSNPSNITAYMAAESKDFVVLPTNAGVKAITENNLPYKLAATITFGNFYIVSMGNDDDENGMDASDTILLFQKNNVPDKIFHYIYGNDLNSAIHYVNAVSDAAQAALTGSFSDPDDGLTYTPNYVLLAQPVLTNVLSKKENVSVYANVQEKYKEVSGNKEIFQASVFVRNAVKKSDTDTFLKCLKKDIEAAIADPSKMTEGMNRDAAPAETFGVAPAMAEAAMRNNNGMGLGFKYAKENKEAIETFLELFNLKDIDEKIYY